MVEVCGSSPLTRGKLSSCVRVQADPGLIPAHAGKTLIPALAGVLAGAHPRSRGENFLASRACTSDPGSSPLTRGKLQEARADLAQAGLIPAHAGKTLLTVTVTLLLSAHPRSRGENRVYDMARAVETGSSPLTRGKPATVTPMAGALGLIPAHAGKTRARSWSPKPPTAHPRSRGENPVQTVNQFGDLGSSPLTRGKLGSDRRRRGSVRLIPAHAGKTRPWMPTAQSRPAHPRSRGENELRELSDFRSQGSSPLTRGKPGRRVEVDVNRRLIPAHAGKTAPSYRGGTSSSAHPRSRGENAPAHSLRAH